MAPRVLRAPAGPAGREIATRELRSEWSISKPARALRSLRRPSHLWSRVADWWLGASPRCPARPCRHLIDFARNSPSTSSNIEFASLELQRFWGVSKNDRDKLRAKFGWRWCRRSPRVPQPGSVDQVARWRETPVAFARWCLGGSETAIAFAGEKWAFLVRFSGAEVMAVSVVPCWGCAVVLLVSTSPCFCVLCANFFALLGRVWVRARTSSPYKRKMAQTRRFVAR